MGNRLFFLIALLCAALTSSQSVQAATHTVTNTNDSGTGSLRKAIIGSSSGDTIDFDSSLDGQTITLTSGELLIDKDLTITGPGADQLAVNGNAASRVFHVGSGTSVTISGLTITGGNSVSDGFGSGIYNDYATLTLSYCTVSGNSAAYGGGSGIYNNHATLTLSYCTVSGNSAADGGGGGIYNDGYGGSATLTLNNSTFSGNSASDSLGGGIYNDGRNGSVTLTITDSTLSGNSAFFGGGIYNVGLSGSATLDITNTILNAGASGGNIYNYAGTVTSHGYNLSSDGGVTNNGGGTGGLTATGDQINTDPNLGSLQDNGGPTFTHALLPGSPAIDAGPPEFDQRGTGFDRVVNGQIDIGAFEVQPPTPTPTPATIQVTVQTSPAGRAFSVDSTNYSATQIFSWTTGSSHTIATTTPQSGDTGVRYAWIYWSDGGAISHTVAPTKDTTFAAKFITQYYLTMSAGTGGHVSPGSSWHSSGTTFSISATASSLYSFSNWTGSGAGSYSGTDNPRSITMIAPISEAATFTHN